VEGKPVDEKPILLWPNEGMNSDIAVVHLKNVVKHAANARIVLAEVFSPFAQSLAQNMELNRVFRDDPSSGSRMLDELAAITKQEFEWAKEGGADGVFYRLQGASPDHSSPMEYGGHYLELDREIMREAWPGGLHLLFVEGGPETYLDFVSDLPAAIFAWDCDKTGVPISAVRRLRKDALATHDREADILFGSNFGILNEWAKNGSVVTNV
jgi:hypothetical protein